VPDLVLSIFQHSAAGECGSLVRVCEVLDRTLPVEPWNSALVAEPPPADHLAVTWIGHSTLLVQMDGVSVLTDPVFSDSCSPVRLPGVAMRYRRPACTVDQLPDRIDAVVISHNHYDHLDERSVTQLQRRYGPRLQWFVPAGLRAWMHTAGCQNVVELSWWDEHEVVSDEVRVRFVCVPSQHWSKRTIWDDNKVYIHTHARLMALSP